MRFSPPADYPPGVPYPVTVELRPGETEELYIHPQEGPMLVDSDGRYGYQFWLGQTPKFKLWDEFSTTEMEVLVYQAAKKNRLLRGLQKPKWDQEAEAEAAA
mmetsp:Transcript_323/g.952  ORF Transcript_323/g.952 Transcript_323/m.952 type:complete len:102 (+) Transcript_323:50-355(+)|eukprot:CAMPEP_0168424208 /NCGR_PEP_ID=MMETSP0228-20121227/34706_1 /TAXON_ID=133427 /ORGANISM="Protoceratium reticulatum, Strain CCCM 535 (=CCMP 1889)" /LENGTH=101 /DNA_ID=CAMNT_0008438195 /DNA_START=39 /DNA_END=344 /DNA_ORIENTATION=+